jgi:DNA modification methylase
VLNTCHIGDCRTLLREFAAAGVRAQTCVTSPPYWGLRDYGVPGQIGMESTWIRYVARLRSIFRLVYDVLADDGTLWLNLGDSYNNFDKWGGGGNNPGKHTVSADGAVPSWAVRKRRLRQPGLKPKDLVGIPWRVAFALQADGWYLRSDIIWHKPNPMPESVTDRPTSAHEHIFLFAKSERYYYDADAIKEPGIWAGPNGRQKSPHAQGFGRRTKEQEAERQDKQRGHGRRHNGFNDRWDAMTTEEQCNVMRNKRNVWTVGTHPYPGAHFAVFPSDLIEPCVLAGSRTGDVVLDPFMGSGTTAQVAEHLGRQWIGCELQPDYLPLQKQRLAQRAMPL